MRWRRAQAIGDRDIARQMRRVFDQFPTDSHEDPAAAAMEYGRLMFDPSGPSMFRRSTTMIRGEKQALGKSFTVGLRADTRDFEQLTKRVSLVSDCLLLSHGPDAEYRHLGEKMTHTVGFDGGDGMATETGSFTEIFRFGMHCPDPTALGAWLLQAEPLLKAGLAWYLPSFSTRTEQREAVTGATTTRAEGPLGQVTAVDYIISGGRVVQASESNPVGGVKDRLVRPILEIDLPFIEGVTLADFSRITVDEFDSYKAFRNFMRTSFLSMDEALNAVQSELALAKLRLEIEREVSAVQSQLTVARRKRALEGVGAAVATSTALLVAVEGSVFKGVVTVLGLTTAGTLWSVIKDRVENGPRPVESGQWYYVWLLSKKSESL